MIKKTLCETGYWKHKGKSQNGGNKNVKLAKFSKNQTFLTLWYVHVRVRIRGLEMFFFQKILRALFSYYLRFEIRPFA